MKNEPEWMLEERLKALDIFYSKPTPQWGGDLSELDFDEIIYYVKPSEKQGTSWDEVPPEIKNTFDKLGIPEAEQKYLSGVSAQYESEVVYQSLEQDLEKHGIIFKDTDTALQEHEEYFKEYFGKVIPASDNKFSDAGITFPKYSLKYSSCSCSAVSVSLKIIPCFSRSCSRL